MLYEYWNWAGYWLACRRYLPIVEEGIMTTIAEQIDSETIDELVQRIVQAVHPSRVLLFGSAAQERMGPDSDIDVLVVVADGTHCLDTTQYLYKQLLGFSLPVDILVATSAMLERHKHNIGLIYHHILAEGKEIYVA